MDIYLKQRVMLLQLLVRQGSRAGNFSVTRSRFWQFFCSVPEVLVTEVADGSVTEEVSAINSTVGLFTMENWLWMHFFWMQKTKNNQIHKNKTKNQTKDG